MKFTRFILLSLGVTLAWCPASFAQRQSAVGPGVIPLDANGILGGVDMSASGPTGTLTVGVVGGPDTNVFTLNNPLVLGAPPAITTAVSSQGNVVFNSGSTVFGNIGVTQPGGPFLLNLSGGNNGTAVNFQGSVFATTLNVTGTGAVNFNSGNTNIVATNFAADGTISLAPNTTVIGALTTTAGADTGTLILGGGSVLNGAVGGAVGLRNVTVAGGSNLAGVTSTITGALDTFSLSLGTNTLNVGGALTIANIGAAGVINTTIASQTVFGNVRPLGATNLGPTLQVRVSVPTSAFIPVGSQFNIVQTQTGTLQSGTNGSVLVVVADPTNPLFVFSAVPPAGTIAGLVTIRLDSTPLQAPLQLPAGGAALPANAAVAGPVAVALQGITPGPDLIPVLAAIDAFTDPVQAVNAIAQLAPSTSSLAAPLVAFQGTRNFQDLWGARLDEVLCSQMSPTTERSLVCQKNDPRSGWWVKDFGSVASQGAQQGFAGYDSKVVGTMLGYDLPLGPETRVGLAGGFSRSFIDGRGSQSNTNFNTYQATAYIGHEHGPWYVNGDVSVGWNDYDGSRHISFTGVDRRADAAYSGQTYSAFATTGYHFYTQGFTVTPLASLQYARVNLNGFNETGAGDIDLKVQSQNYDFLESGLGMKVARDIHTGDGIYVPDVHAKWLRALGNPTVQQNASFAAAGSPSFSTTGPRNSADTYNVGAGFTFLSCSCSTTTWSLEAVYDYDWRRDNYSEHRASVRVSGRF